MLPLKALGEETSLPLPSFWWLLAVLGLHWCIGASLQSLPLSSCGIFLSVLVSVSKFPSSYKDTSHWIREHSHQVLPHFNMITSTEGHIHGYWG